VRALLSACAGFWAGVVLIMSAQAVRVGGRTDRVLFGLFLLATVATVALVVWALVIGLRVLAA
jgi:hypothetical protein